MGIIRYGRTAQIGVYPGNQSGRFISYRSKGDATGGPPLGGDTTLWYKFDEDKSLDARIGPTLDCVRASTATYVGADKLIKTALANEPRFDHDPVTGESLGLLVEEARTNICLYSQDFSQASWTKTASVVTADATIAPDGSLTADRLTDNNAGGTGNPVVRRIVSNIGTSTTFTWSAFVKADQLDWTRLQCAAFGALVVDAYFDLTNGVVGTVSADVDDSGIEDYGNGWYRCWISFTTDGADDIGEVRIRIAEADGDDTVDLDGTSSIFIWGADLASGAFPTSHIPTTTASVTRAADDVNTTDLIWFNQDVGTFYVDNTPTFTDNGSTTETAALSMRASSINYHILSNTTVSARTGRGLYSIRNSAAHGVETDTDVYAPPGTRVRHVGAFDISGGEIAITANGTAVNTLATTSIAPTPTVMDVGAWNGGAHQNGHIREVAYANVRLPDDELQAVTQP